MLLVALLMLACLLAATANRCDMIPRGQGAELYTECQAKMGGARTRSGTMAGGTPRRRRRCANEAPPTSQRINELLLLLLLLLLITRICQTLTIRGDFKTAMNFSYNEAQLCCCYGLFEINRNNQIPAAFIHQFPRLTIISSNRHNK